MVASNSRVYVETCIVPLQVELPSGSPRVAVEGSPVSKGSLVSPLSSVQATVVSRAASSVAGEIVCILSSSSVLGREVRHAAVGGEQAQCHMRPASWEVEKAPVCCVGQIIRY